MRKNVSYTELKNIDEKEILYIVAKTENKSDIMKAIAGYTYAENAHPVAFSLPITESAGFRLMD